MTPAAAEKLGAKLRKLFALLGSANEHEREAARLRIDEILTKNRKSWNDLTELISSGKAHSWHADDDDAPPPADASRKPAPLDLIRHMLGRYVALTEPQLVAVTLWIAHTHLYRQFSVTPRLAALSPVRGCGKSTLLNVIKALGRKTRKLDSLTPALLYHTIDRERATMLIDEADNADLMNNRTLRQIINGGHGCDGNVGRFIGGEPVEFSQLVILRSLILRFEHELEPPLKPIPRLATEKLRQRLEWLDSEIIALRDRSHLLQEEITLKTAEQTNRNLQVLAIVTTVFLPASLIAGIFGMNVSGLPLTGDSSGFVWALVLLVGVSAFVFWLLKRSGILRR